MKSKLFIFVIIFLSSFSAYAVKCADFDTQREAQEYMENGGSKRLDGDKDGEACECLPGGSSYNKSICKSWHKKNGK